MNIDDLLLTAIAKGASDVHFTPGLFPMIRVKGAMKPIENAQILTLENCEDLKNILLNKENLKNIFLQHGDCDFSYSIKNNRFRVNLYRTSNGTAIAMRVINEKIPSLDSLYMPPTLKLLTEKQHGLIIITGPTGSGKSTTLAAMIDYINQIYPYHIITIEDPIEYLHNSYKSVINQREVGSDVDSFHTGLKSALRQDPDVILVGEMRDKETIKTALNAAETGHLVLSTLHTSSVIEAVDRILQYFPGNQQAQICSQLANCFEAIIAQKLLKRKDGSGRIAAVEILTRTPATTNLIRTGKAYQLNDYMHSTNGMQLMEDAINDLKMRNVI